MNFTADGVAPLKALTLAIDPVQDLHGYDSPWPAGGGANLFNPSYFSAWSSSVIYTVSGDDLTVNQSDGQAWSSIPEYSLKAGTYTLYRTNGAGSVQLRSSDDDYAANAMTINPTVLSNTFTLANDGGIKFKVGINASDSYPFTTKVMIVKGSTAPTAWTPYSNECPISGWSAANVYDDPKHGGTVWWNQQFLAASEWEAHSVQSSVSVSDGVITATLISGTPAVYAPAIAITGGTTVTTIAKHKYYMACKFNPAADGFPYVRNNTAFPDAGPFGMQVTRAGEWGSYENIISATANGGPAWYIGNGGNTSQIQTGDSFSIKDLMCIDLTAMFGAGNEPATVEEFRALFPKDYYAYNAGEETLVSAVNGDPYRAVTIDLDGTRYGGTCDVVNGVLRVDYRLLNAADVTWRKSGDVVYYAPSDLYTTVSADTPTGRKPLLCNTFSYYSGSSMRDGDIGYGGINNNGNITIRSSVAASTLEDWNDYIANNTVQIVYPLATPLTYTLTPQQLDTLAGQNVVWADCGDVMVEYRKGENALLQDISEAIKNLQGKIRVSGLLKGDGNGNVTAAINGTDYSKVIIRDWSVT